MWVRCPLLSKLWYFQSLGCDSSCLTRVLMFHPSVCVCVYLLRISRGLCVPRCGGEVLLLCECFSALPLVVRGCYYLSRRSPHSFQNATLYRSEFQYPWKLWALKVPCHFMTSHKHTHIANIISRCLSLSLSPSVCLFLSVENRGEYCNISFIMESFWKIICN